jgi:tetratricopeptide (TPR) repeat protein
MTDTEANPQAMKVIESHTMDDYMFAAEKMQDASVYKPGSSYYLRELAAIHSMLGSWYMTMDSLGSEPFNYSVKKDEAYQKAIDATVQAIRLEPTNPDTHLQLAKILELSGAELNEVAAELRNALRSYPGNSPVRYAVAAQYLRLGMKEKALEHSRTLAELDESYMAHFAADKDDWVGGLNPFIIQRYYRSYLFSALELAWRASGDINVVASIAPLNDDAGEVLLLFLDWRGLKVD